MGWGYRFYGFYRLRIYYRVRFVRMMSSLLLLGVRSLFYELFCASCAVLLEHLANPGDDVCL